MSGDVRRLLAYAKGLGLTVKFKPYNPITKVGGEYSDETKEIVVYRSKKDSSHDITLVLLHELGHHLDFIYKGKRDSKRLEAALKKSEGESEGILARSYRKSILECEIAGTGYMPQITKELDLRIPMWKVVAEMKLDQWIARRFYQSGHYPTVAEIKSKRNELRNKLKERV